MATKRSKVLNALDPVMSVPSNHRTEQAATNEINERMRMNTENRKSNDNIDNVSKITANIRSKAETLRPNSPTFKRLVAVRIKLEKYLVVISNTASPSQKTISESSNYEQPATATTVNIPLSAGKSEKRIRSKTKPNTAALDKITYEKTRTHNGDIKQKCSLEIWLPKAGSDDDDANTTRTATPDPHINETNSQSAQSVPIKSRQSDTVKHSATTTSETKSLDELLTKKHEPKIMPRVYHYGEYLNDQGEERPRSGKSGNSNKLDANGSNRNLRRHRTRTNLRHISPTISHTEETVQWPSSALPMSARNLMANIKQNSAGIENKGTLNSTSTMMINELMRKYTLIKKNHQELTQPRLQLEKPNTEPKHTTHVTKDASLLSSPLTDTASHISIDQSMISTKKLLGETLLPPSTADHTSTKPVDRRASAHKPSQGTIYHQTRLFSLVNQTQHRQASAAMPSAILPVVIGRKNEEPIRSLERSKTLDVVFAISNDDTYKIPSRLPARPESPQNHPNLLARTVNGMDHSPARLPKRSLLPPSHILRSERPRYQASQSLVQLIQYQNIQNTPQRYHLGAPSSATTDLSTNKVLVHLKYSNGASVDRNCLVPD